MLITCFRVAAIFLSFHLFFTSTISAKTVDFTFCAKLLTISLPAVQEAKALLEIAEHDGIDLSTGYFTADELSIFHKFLEQNNSVESDYFLQKIGRIRTLYEGEKSRLSGRESVLTIRNIAEHVFVNHEKNHEKVEVNETFENPIPPELRSLWAANEMKLPIQLSAELKADWKTFAEELERGIPVGIPAVKKFLEKFSSAVDVIATAWETADTMNDRPAMITVQIVARALMNMEPEIDITPVTTASITASESIEFETARDQFMLSRRVLEVINQRELGDLSGDDDDEDAWKKG